MRKCFRQMEVNRNHGWSIERKELERVAGPLGCSLGVAKKNISVYENHLETQETAPVANKQLQIWMLIGSTIFYYTYLYN